MQRRSTSLRQQPDRIHLQAACRVVDPDQKFLPLHQGMKAAIVQHPRMDEHILIQIVGRDKAVSAKIIEELHDGAHLAILGLAGGRRCRRERPFDRQQILDHPAMLIGAERYGHDIAGQEPHEAEPVQCRAVKKYFLVTDAHEPVSLAFIVPDQLAFTDLYVTACFLLHFHHPARRHTMGRNGTKLLVTRSIEAG